MTNPTNNTAPANTTVNKSSTMETLKDKAANLVHKVTGKGHTDTTHHNTDNTLHNTDNTLHSTDNKLHNTDHHDHHHDQHKNLDGTTSTKHGDVNPSAFLSSVRFPDDGAGAGMAAAAPSNITQPEAIHDPSQPRHHAGIIPTHSANTTANPNPNVRGIDGTHAQHQHNNHHGAEAAAGLAAAGLAAEGVHKHHEHEREHERQNVLGTTNSQAGSHVLGERQNVVGTTNPQAGSHVLGERQNVVGTTNPQAGSHVLGERQNVVGITNPQAGSHALGEHGHHHNLDDPQHGITSRLTGPEVGGDPSLTGATTMQHPVM